MARHDHETQTLPPAPWSASNQYGMHFILSHDNRIILRADHLPMDLLKAMVRGANRHFFADQRPSLSSLPGSGRSSVVTVRVTYEKGSAHFETNLELNEISELGVTKDHIVMDAIREISNEWSEMVHDEQNAESSHGDRTESQTNTKNE